MAKSILQKAIEELQTLAEKQDEAIFVYPEFGDKRSYKLIMLEPYLDLLIVQLVLAGLRELAELAICGGTGQLHQTQGSCRPRPGPLR